MCSSGNHTGTGLDEAICVVVKLSLPGARVTGPLNYTNPNTQQSICSLTYLQVLPRPTEPPQRAAASHAHCLRRAAR
eukprot:4401346-Prymnesium_polylepis.1